MNKYYLSVRNSGRKAILTEQLNGTSLLDVINYVNSFNNDEELKWQLMGDLSCGFDDLDDLSIDYYESDKDRKENKPSTRLIPGVIPITEGIRFFDIRYLQRYYVKHIKEYDFAITFLQAYGFFNRKNAGALSNTMESIKKNIKFEGTEVIIRNKSLLNEDLERFIYCYCVPSDERKFRTLSDKEISDVALHNKIRELARIALNHEKVSREIAYKGQLRDLEIMRRHYEFIFNDYSPEDQIYIINEINSLDLEIEEIEKLLGRGNDYGELDEVVIRKREK